MATLVLSNIDRLNRMPPEVHNHLSTFQTIQDLRNTKAAYPNVTLTKEQQKVLDAATHNPFIRDIQLLEFLQRVKLLRPHRVIQHEKTLESLQDQIEDVKRLIKQLHADCHHLAKRIQEIEVSEAQSQDLFLSQSAFMDEKKALEESLKAKEQRLEKLHQTLQELEERSSQMVYLTQREYQPYSEEWMKGISFDQVLLFQKYFNQMLEIGFRGWGERVEEKDTLTSAKPYSTPEYDELLADTLDFTNGMYELDECEAQYWLKFIDGILNAPMAAVSKDACDAYPELLTAKIIALLHATEAFEAGMDLLVVSNTYVHLCPQEKQGCFEAILAITLDCLMALELDMEKSEQAIFKILDYCQKHSISLDLNQRRRSVVAQSDEPTHTGLYFSSDHPGNEKIRTIIAEHFEDLEEKIYKHAAVEPIFASL